MIEWFFDPRFWWLTIGGSIVSMVAFALFAGLLTWLAWAEPKWAQPYRIQTRRAKGAAIIWPSIKQWLINNAWMTTLVVLSWPLIRLTDIHLGPLPPIWLIVLQLLLFIYLDDFLYYWMHRTMHRNRWLYRKVHCKHHVIMTPWAITGHYMHPAEYVATGLLMLLGPALVGAHILVLYLWVIFRQLEAAEGHCGYDLPFSPTRWLPFSDGAVHHDYHHAKIHGNYAGYLPWTDRVFGTFVPGYQETRK